MLLKITMLQSSILSRVPSSKLRVKLYECILWGNNCWLSTIELHLDIYWKCHWINRFKTQRLFAENERVMLTAKSGAAWGSNGTRGSWSEDDLTFVDSSNFALLIHEDRKHWHLASEHSNAHLGLQIEVSATVLKWIFEAILTRLMAVPSMNSASLSVYLACSYTYRCTSSYENACGKCLSYTSDNRVSCHVHGWRKFDHSWSGPPSKW